MALLRARDCARLACIATLVRASMDSRAGSRHGPRFDHWRRTRRGGTSAATFGRFDDPSPPAGVCRVPRGTSAAPRVWDENASRSRDQTRRDAVRPGAGGAVRVRRGAPNALAKRRSRRVAPARRSDNAPGGRRGASAPGAAEGGAGPANAGRESGVPLSPGAQRPGDTERSEVSGTDTSLNHLQSITFDRRDLVCGARTAPGLRPERARTDARPTPGPAASHDARPPRDVPSRVRNDSTHRRRRHPLRTVR